MPKTAGVVAMLQSAGRPDADEDCLEVLGVLLGVLHAGTAAPNRGPELARARSRPRDMAAIFTPRPAKTGIYTLAVGVSRPTGADGNRTHQEPRSDPSSALKTAGPTRNPDAPLSRDETQCTAIVRFGSVRCKPADEPGCQGDEAAGRGGGVVRLRQGRLAGELRPAATAPPCRRRRAGWCR